MAELKTRPNDGDVGAFLASVSNDRRRVDALTLLDMMKKITGEEPRMWGSAIIGFGSYRYRYESGREGDWFVTGFSPRKQATTIYVMSGFGDQSDLMERLGKHRTGKACLYINNLEDVDLGVLEQLIRRSVDAALH